jgi:nicotinate-nucleotide adenylyltransferase
MNSLKPAIGILGGTFDPIHFGHLRTAIELHQALHLAEVRLIPCYQPVHRKMPMASPEQRLKMVQEAIASEPALHADDCEIRRQGPSYTIDTLHTLRTALPHTPLCVIMGIDALLSFTSWHQWEAILEISHLIIAHRPQYQLPQTGVIADILKKRLRQHARDLHTQLAGNIVLHSVTPLDISSTDIRKQIANDKNPRYLLPDRVYNYIQEHGTYSVNRL